MDTNQTTPAANTNTNNPAPAQEANAKVNVSTLLENVEEVEQKSVWGYLIWGLSIPPVSTIIALLIALKRGTFFLVLPSLTLAFSLISLISPIFVYLLFGPIKIVTTQFAYSQNIYQDPKLTFLSMFLIIISIAGIIAGIYTRRRAKHSLTLAPIALVALLVILVLEHVILWINMTSALGVISKQTQVILNQQGVPF